MDYSNHKDAKGSKVLKVALSAALAAAFTPMAAIPAFAVEGTGGGSGPVIAPKSAAECISSALAYEYSTSGSAYTYNGTLFADGTTLLGGFTPAQAAADGSGVMNDMARFLGALYRFDSGTSVKAIKYGNAKYVWNGAANLKGSNWVIENGAATQGNTLVAAITKDLAEGLLKNYGASVTLGISSDDGTSYTNITLKTSISTAKLTHDGKTDGKVYSLEDALKNAVSGDTVTMTSDTITKTQLSLPAGVTLDGNGKTLTHLSNDNTNNGERGAIQLLAQETDAVADTAAIKNLTIVGPNSDTKNWTSGEFGIKAYGNKADLVIQDVTINRAQTAIQATKGAEVTIKNSLKIGDVELGGIEVSEDANSKLVLDESAKITYSNETAATPFAWVENGGSITNYTNLELAKVDKTAIDGKAKFHYYLNASDSNGAHFYTDVTDLKNDTLSSKSVTLGAGSGEYALVKFVPSTSGTYYFASEGTVDAAAELYTMAANGGLGTKITQGDDEQGYSFKLCATLTAGSSYILKVYSLDKMNEIKLDSGTVDTASLSNYTVERTSTIACYDDENLTASSAKLAVKVTSLIDGKTLAADKYTATIWTTKTDNTKDTEVNGAIAKAGRYILEVTPKEGSGLKDSAYCYFNVLGSKDISNYDFKYTTAVIYNGQAVSIKTLAPKGYRLGTSTLVFDESNLAVEGWYSVDKDGNETKLANAPSAVGNYVLKVSPTGKTTSGAAASYDTNEAVELPFSITKGKVTAPTAKTGLVYTGKAQTGVATGTGYTLSGTASATDAGSYTCTATLAEGYSWADGTLAPKTFTWSIAKAKIAVPTAVIGLVYTGKAQSGVATGTGYTLSGTTSATEPGDYTATATPTANYTWTDGTTTAKQIKWTLSKAQPGISATPSTVAIAAGGKASVTLKQAGTASYSVTSSDTKVATASVTGSTVSISAVASGTAKITVSTAADKHYAAGSAVITVNVPKVKGATDATTNTVVQPDGTTKTVIDAYVVTKAPNLADSSVVPTVKFTGTTATGAVTIPASVTLSDGFTYKVTAIDADAFYGSKVTAVTISAGVTRIGNSAFEDCTKLTSVTIPSSVTVVGKGAFDGCTKLAKVRVINGKIYKNAFKGCKKLGTITIGKKVKSIGANAFKNTKAKTVTLKSAKLSKTSIKNLVKGSKITTIKGTGLSKKVKAKYAKWAKAYKANVKVK